MVLRLRLCNKIFNKKTLLSRKHLQCNLVASELIQQVPKVTFQLLCYEKSLIILTGSTIIFKM